MPLLLHERQHLTGKRVPVFLREEEASAAGMIPYGVQEGGVLILDSRDHRRIAVKTGHDLRANPQNGAE